MLDIFLLSLALGAGDIDHKTLVMAERYEQAMKLEKLCRKDSTFYFYQTVACWKTKDYVKASRCIKIALEKSEALAERHKVCLEHMQDELGRMQESNNKILDISTDMDIVERRLRLGMGGPSTQTIQKEVIRKLDEEIKKIEDQMAKVNQDSGASKNGKQHIPLENSKIMEQSGEGKVENKKLIQSGDNWGKLPEKEKAKALQSINNVLPPHIREAAEGFSKKINERK